MANSPSARKRIRTAARRTQINKTRLSSIRTFVKKVEAALEAGNADAAKTAFHDAQPLIMRGVAKGVLHKNTASRKISRLSIRIKKLNASAG